MIPIASSISLYYSSWIQKSLVLLKSKVNWDLWFRVNPITTRLCLFPRCRHLHSVWVTALMRPIGRYFVTRTTRDTRLPSLQCFVRLTEYGANPLALWDWRVFYPETYHPIVSWILFSISIRTLVSCVNQDWTWLLSDFVVIEYPSFAECGPFLLLKVKHTCNLSKWSCQPHWSLLHRASPDDWFPRISNSRANQ